MKKGLKKIIVVMLVFVMVLGTLTGCKKEEPNDAAVNNTEEADDTEKADDTKNADATDAPEVEAVAGIEGWQPFAENVTITVPVYDRAREGAPAVDDNYWTKWVQANFGDKYNVTVDYVPITRTDVMTDYNLLIAADDTPTILMEYDYPKVAQWANDGAMCEVDLEAFAQVAPNYYQKMVDNKQLDYTDLNGKTYFVLSERPYYNIAYSWAQFVRKDWLDAVGKALPQNYAEYVAAIDAIKVAGLTDQAPIGLYLPTDAQVINYAFRDFPVDEAEWAMYASLGSASLNWEPTKEFLKRQNSEYNKGYFSTEYELDTGGIDASQAKTDFINGKTYSYWGYMSSNVDWLTAFYENNPDAELVLQSPYNGIEPGVADVPCYRSGNPFGMIVGFSSSAEEDQLKAAWMYMEWMSQEDVLYTLENGVEGVTYTLDAEGLPIVNTEYAGEERLNYNNNIDMTCVVHALKVVGTIEQTIRAITPQGLPQDLYQQLVDNYYVQANETSKYAYTDPIFAVPIASDTEYSSALLSLWQEYSAALTKCKPEEFDAMYADLSQRYLDAGYQEIIDERLAAYKAGNSTKLPK